MGGPGREFARADRAFFQQNAAMAEINAFPLAPADFAAVNPNTGTAPVFRTLRDAEITRGIYRRLPVLVDHRHKPPRYVWPVRYSTMFHMTNDSGKFRTEADLVKLGAYRVAGGWWEKGSAKWLPLYEGKMVQAYDHRAASIVVNSENLKRPAYSMIATEAYHADPAWSPVPQFWVSANDLLEYKQPWVIGLKHISSTSNVRTVICAICPSAGYGNSLPVIVSQVSKADETDTFAAWAPLLEANLNSFPLDFVVRQKLHGNNLNWFEMEQLPVVPPEAYDCRFGPRTAGDIVREDVLHLTYTAHDMEPFARDQGYQGPPFAWDEEDRLRRRARLDAVFFHLYGPDRDDADYVLSTFPIVKREEEQRYQGRSRSRDLILGHMAALAAGAPDANIAG
jgi:hypothetical protein